MGEANLVPKFANSLSVFVGDLRAWVFSSQVKAAEYFNLQPPTVSRYENGHIKPQLGYLAGLARLFIDRLAREGQAVEDCQKALLQEVNKALYGYYVDEEPFRDWNELCCVADNYVAKQRVARHSTEPPHNRGVDWGESPDLGVFYGRGKELDELARWISDDGCRLVVVLGLGGMGKTTLVLKLVERIQNQFDNVIWRSLRNAPPIDGILNDCIGSLLGQSEYDVSDSVTRKISLLVECLRERRCLLVLDGVEAILREGVRAGRYRDGYAVYRGLIRRIGETRHQSCLVLTSREKPRGIARLEGTASLVRTFQLDGLGVAEGKEILRDKGLVIPEEAGIVLLVERYSGNPLALKFVAETIQKVFAGDIDRFLSSETSIFGGVRRLFDQQFSRLSKLELEIMYWLAIEREAISVKGLRENIVHPLSTGAVVEALESLVRRSLVERNANGVTLHDVVLDYATARLIDQVCEELTSEAILWFQSCALIQAQAKECVRQSQVRLILQPIIQRLVAGLGRAALEEKLRHLLATLRAEARTTPGYAGGNVFNLLLHLGYDIQGYDFSGLAIRQACLRDAALHEVSFAQADLTQSVFTDAFVGVSAITFSPDGKLLAAGTGEEIRLWQVASGRLCAIFEGHTDLIWAVAFSPGGCILVSGSADQTVRLWDVCTGQVLGVLHGHTDWVWSVAFGPGGEMLASGGKDRTVRLWNVRTGQTLHVLSDHTDTVFSVAFDSNGRLLASGSADRTIRLWDVCTGQSLHVLEGHTGAVLSVAFSPDGCFLASGSKDQTIRLWDIRVGQTVCTLNEHTDAISSIAFSPDGTTLASGSYDYTICLWDVKRDVGKLVHVLKGHFQEVRSVAFSPDGQVLVSGSYDRTIRLWDTGTGQALCTLHGYSQEVRSVAFSPDGKTLASGGTDQAVHLWDTRTGRVRYNLPGHSRWVASVAFSPDGRILASGSYDRTVRLWDACTGQALHILYRHVHWVWFVAFSPDGQTLASGGAGQKVCLRDVRTGKTIRTLKGHTRGVQCVAFDPDGATLASGSDDQTVRLWDVRTGQTLCTLQGHFNRISSVAFSPDGAILVSGSEDQTVRLWDTRTGQALRTLDGHTGAVSTVAYGPDERILASGSADQTVRLWDAHTGQVLHVLHEHTSPVSSIAFSPDGAALASASLDGAVKLWEVRTGECLKTLRSERPYEGMNITGVSGLTEVQKVTLKALGAVEC